MTSFPAVILIVSPFKPCMNIRSNGGSFLHFIREQAKELKDIEQHVCSKNAPPTANSPHPPLKQKKQKKENKS